MVDSINIPFNLTKVIEVKDTSDVLRRFLTDLVIKVDNLEKTIAKQATEIKVLQNP
jgi:hypothetical protein